MHNLSPVRNLNGVKLLSGISMLILALAPVVIAVGMLLPSTL